MGWAEFHQEILDAKEGKKSDAPTMKASQTVFLTQDGKAVAEGDKAARFLLVRKGGEISQEKAAKYEGAVELIGGTKKPAPSEAVQTRDPAPQHRDPLPPIPPKQPHVDRKGK